MTEDGPTRLLSGWGQLLALVLTGAVLMQGANLQASLQVVLESGPKPCVCEERGFCPQNPDGPCQCEEHHHSSDEKAPKVKKDTRTGDHWNEHSEKQDDRPILKDCEETGTGTALVISFHKWVLPPALTVDVPPFFERSYTGSLQTLSPQKVGDEFFHPPRPAVA